MIETRLELSKPPIVEAGLRIAFTPPSEASWNFIFGETIKLLPQYRKAGEISVDGPGVSLQVLAAVSVDGLHVFRLSPGEFIFSRLAPYTGWQSFFTEARRVWDQVRHFLGGAEVHTFGLRYINKLHWPVSSPISNYLRLFPAIPTSDEGVLPHAFNLYMRLTFQIEKPQGVLTVQEIQLPSESPDMVTMALDNQLDFAGVGLHDALIWEQLELARGIKNYYFAEFLSPSYLETFR
jgi:uncharacterized protein (TIGR04255 family)